MAETTIEWTRGPNGEQGYTFNPWEGCQKVGPGCDHCYAEARNARFSGGAPLNWGPGAPRRRTSAANWRKPIAWNAEAARTGIRPRVFCASLADVFDNAVDPQWRADLFELIRATPNLDWLLLTKRIGNVANMLPVPFDFERQYPNVWLGATIVNQGEADRDIPKLLATPAAKRFLSMEPLLGPVDLTDVADDGDRAMDVLTPYLWETESAAWRESGENDWEADFEDFYSVPVTKTGPMHPTIDWVIVGGESGSGARPMHPDWARSLRDQCAAAGVPFLFKQWGEWADMSHAGIVSDGPVHDRWGNVADWMRRRPHFADGSSRVVQGHSWTVHATDLMYRVGKKAAGRLLDGVQHDGMPAEIIFPFREKRSAP